MTEKLELYIDIANGTRETGFPDIRDKYKTIVQLLALIKEKDYANINIMCLETSSNGIYDCLYKQDNCVTHKEITKAAEKYNKEAFAAPTTKVNKPALVFIEKSNEDLLEKESFQKNILGNKKAIIIQYTEINLMPLIIILSLIAYNSLDNQVIRALVAEERARRYLADIQLDFADPELVHLTATNTDRSAKISKLEAHAKYLQMVPKLAEIKELEVVTAQFEAKETLSEIKKQNPNAMKGGAGSTKIPDPMSIVIKILNIINAVIIPEEVSNVVIKAQGRNPDKYFKKDGAGPNILSRELIMLYVVKYYTQQKDTADYFAENINKRHAELIARQWKFLKEPKNISKIRYCKLAIEHIERRFRNKGFTIDETFTNGDNKDLYDKIMRYGIGYREGTDKRTESQFPEKAVQLPTINIMLMDKEETEKADAEYIAYVIHLLHNHNKKETVMLYSDKSIGTLKLLFKGVTKEPTEADYK